MRNLIGNTHEITQNMWALSLVRKMEADHAYLILEGVDEEGGRATHDAHFVVKAGTNNKKGEVVFREYLSISKLREVAEGCHSYTWALEKAQVDRFIEIVRAEQVKDIDYVMGGKTNISGLFGASLEGAGSSESKESLVNSSLNNPSLDLLLRKGHNCGSWAVGVVQALGLKAPTSWLSCVIHVPRNEVKGTHNADEEEPTTRCLMM